MGQVLTNNTGFIFAREASSGVLPATPDWKIAEPNSIDSFGANNTLVPREPISKLRQRRKGSVVKRDADAEFSADQTIDTLHDFTEAFVHATAVNADMTFRAASTLSGGYTVPALTAAQAAKFQFTVTLGPFSLVHALGYTNSGNNSAGSVLPITGTVATSAVLIPVTGRTVETAPSNAEVSIAGIRAEAGDLAIVGIDAEFVVPYDTESGSGFVVGELLTFSGGATANLIILDDQGLFGNLTIDLLSGTLPVDNETLTGGTSATTAAVNGTPTVATHTLTSSNGSSATPLDFTTLGLTIGQTVHIGGLTSANRFGSSVGGTNDSFGTARIRVIAAQQLTIDKLGSALKTSNGTDTGIATGTEVATDLLFGRFIRNVQSDDAAFAAISYTIETSLLNLFVESTPTNPNGFEYVVGARANQMVWSMPLSDKSTATFSFIGTEAEDPVNDLSRKTGASAARLPLFTGAMNTAADFFRLGIADVDDDGLTSDFKDLTVTLNNNVSGEFVLGQAGAKFINTGNFDVTVEAQALFTNPVVANRITENATITMAWTLRNDDGAVAVDIPSATINSDGKEYPVNESVRINLTLDAFVDPLFLTSIGVSLFPVYPAS